MLTKYILTKSQKGTDYFQKYFERSTSKMQTHEVLYQSEKTVVFSSGRFGVSITLTASDPSIRATG